MLYLLILLLGGMLSFFGPWWIIAPVCFFLCWMFAKRTGQAFWVSAFGGVTLWLGYSLYLHFTTGSDLVAKVAGIFTAGTPALADVPGVGLVLFVASLVAALVSGFSGLSGVLVKQFIRQPR